MPSDQIVSSVAEAAASAVRLMTGLETYRSFKLDRATSVADGIPPTNHDDIADTASSYCNAYADSMERDAEAFRQIGITLAEADAMAAASIESIS